MAGRSRTHWLIALAAALACDARPAAVADAPDALPLAQLAFAELELPESSLPAGFEREVDLPLEGWQLAAADGASGTFVLELEQAVPQDATLVDPRGRVLERSREDQRPHDERASSRHGIWKLAGERIELSVPGGGPEPRPGTHRLRFRNVSEREASWNRGSQEGPGFARRQVTVGHTTRSGLLLPAPARVAWDVVVPPAAELHLRPGLLQADWPDGLESDGFDLRIEVEPAQGEPFTTVRRVRDDDFELLRVDLSRFAGESVRLRIVTDPGRSPDRDYAFVAEPVLASRRTAPRRAVIVFIDTLRPDRLGLYGHAADTSPTLDSFAGRGAVFEQARSVAPWTLPAVRSLLTGRQPEAWGRAVTLPGLLASRGFATAMLGANHFLLASFGSQRDWDLHHVVPWGSARDQTDLALDWLEQVEGRDALLIVHYMDPHLPYAEPPSYRGRFGSTTAPGDLGELYSREAVEQLAEGGERDRLRRHLLERYDANIRYVDDQLVRLFAAISTDDLVIVLSDHGEEFFEHGGFEHGHALWDELLRVPLLIWGRGVVARRHREPVSLLDVTPTVLDWLGLPTGSLDGRSLAPLLRGQAAGEPRSIAFGRPLYDGEGWGIVRRGEKYVARHGFERRSRVAESAGQGEAAVRRRAVSPGIVEPLRDALGPALGREVVTAWRLVVGETSQWPREDLIVELEVAGGIERAWWAPDPTRRSSVALDIEHASGRIVASWRAGYRGQRELFVQPLAGIDPASPPTVRIRRGGASRSVGSIADPERGIFLQGAAGADRSLSLTLAVVPAPEPGATELMADDPVLREQLRALGYLVGEERPDATR
ncbi:MAG: sulfatase [Myxococcota bacterium]|nr:sulfatase [Myxococcota bacterium]